MTHILILFGAGWFLLVPPIKLVGYSFEIDRERPISEWEQRAAYDTAKECETGKSIMEGPVWKYLAERIEQQKQEEKAPPKMETPLQKDDTFKPSDYLTKLDTDVATAVKEINAMGCGFSDPRGDTQECKAKRDEFAVKYKVAIRQDELERQKQETKEQTEKRRKEFDEALGKYREKTMSDTKVTASMQAILSARCVPTDVLLQKK